MNNLVLFSSNASGSSDSSYAFIGAGFPVMRILVLAVIGFGLFACARIISKSGHSWVWVFILFVPIANLVMLCLFAFQEWPIEREVKMLRAQLYGSQYPPSGQFPQFAQGWQYSQYPGPQYPAQPGVQYPGEYSTDQVPPTSPYGG